MHTISPEEWAREKARHWKKTKEQDLSKMKTLTEGFISNLQINPSVFSSKSVRVLPPLWFGLGTKSFTHWCESQIPLTRFWSGEQQPVQAGSPSTPSKNHPMYCCLREGLGFLNKSPALLWCEVHFSLPVGIISRGMSSELFLRHNK